MILCLSTTKIAVNNKNSWLQLGILCAVIEEYLRSKNRDPIAMDLRLGSGTVSKIISEWKIGLLSDSEQSQLQKRPFHFVN